MDLKYKILIALLVIMFAGFIMQKFNTKEKFDDMSTEKKDVMVQFYKMKQCGHCVSFAPIFEQFIETVKQTNKSVGFMIIDADDEKSQSLIEENNIEGFPTVIFIKDGKKHIFDGDRTLKGLETFLEKL